MAYVFAVTNQKGGVGKTTTTLNIGAGLAERGYKVLFIDMDPQCSLTYILGGDSNVLGVYDVITGRCPAASAIQKLEEGSLISANPALSTVDTLLVETGREYRLKYALNDIQNLYDYVIIDSPPNLGVLTLNILTAANSVIIPVLADIFSLQGVGQLYSTIRTVKAYSNPTLSINGMLLIRHNDRFLLNRAMRDMLNETAVQLGTRVYSHSIREGVTVREAEANQMSLFAYAPKHRQTKDYREVIDEIISKNSDQQQ